MRRRTTEVLEQLHLDIDVRRRRSRRTRSPCSSWSSIARAVDVDARVLILDEPTSSLDAREVDELFEVMRKLRASGVAVCSSPTSSIRCIASRPHHGAAQRATRRRVPAPPSSPRWSSCPKMLGRSSTCSTSSRHEVGTPPTRCAPTFLRATGLGRTARDRADRPRAARRRGRRVGRPARLRSHRDRPTAVRRRPRRQRRTIVVTAGTRLRNPRVALAHGIAFCLREPQDRGPGRRPDACARTSCWRCSPARGWARAIPRRQQAEIAERYIKALDIRPPDPEAIVGNAVAAATSRRSSSRAGCSPQPKLLHPRRADARHRRRRQGRDPASRRRPRGGRHVVLFISAELEEVVRTVASHRGHARAAQGRRGRQPGTYRRAT